MTFRTHVSIVYPKNIKNIFKSLIWRLFKKFDPEFSKKHFTIENVGTKIKISAFLAINIIAPQSSKYIY